MKRYIRISTLTPGGGNVYVSQDDINLQYILTKLLIMNNESVLVPVDILSSIVQLEVPHLIMESPIETSIGILSIYYITKQKSLLIRKIGESHGKR